MEQMNDLKALLKHDVQMLCSTEDQIIDALPDMIDKASNPQLKQGLGEHLEVSKRQRQRLDQVNQLLNASSDDATKDGGLMDKMMGGKCVATKGIIDAGKNMMQQNLSADVMDAAIIGAAQKIEHFEIASYGTVRTYAKQLGLTDVANLLQQTLDEEYMADQELTSLAEQKVNKDATAGSAALR